MYSKRNYLRSSAADIRFRKFPVFTEIWKHITMLKRTCHWILKGYNSVQKNLILETEVQNSVQTDLLVHPEVYSFVQKDLLVNPEVYKCSEGPVTESWSIK
jgi:hypothetical protein